MSLKISLLLPVVLALLPAFTSAADDASQSLFDGKSLQGWSGDAAHWRVADGAIVGEIPDGKSLDQNQFLFWEGTVADFDLSVEFRISGGRDANSGIQFRSQRTENGGAAGLQADLDQGETWLGRIYDEHGRALVAERGKTVSIAPDGRRWADKFAEPADFAGLLRRDGWNTYRIRAAGPHIEIWINGRRVTVLDDHQIGHAEYKGLLAFQLHSGAGPAKVQFRNIRLVNLGETEFPRASAAALEKGNRQTESPVLWHLRANPAKPSPIDNAEAQGVVANMKLTDGFEAELVAAEPDLHQPIAFAIDERGRLWVVEAFSYPNKQPDGQGKDKVLILEDRDGDGRFETQKTFIEGLNLVSGIEVGLGGVWIGAAPELLFIPDRDADDKPDGPPQVLLDGFGYQDTHETLNSFTWGPDGWLYGNQGVFNTAQIGKPGAAPEQRTTLRAGIWRYHPLRHEFEVFAHGGSNQWGLAFNEIGDLFTTHCRSYWGGGGTTNVIRNGHFWNQTNSNYPDFISNAAPRGIPHLQNFLPASARYDSGEGGAGKPGTGAIYGGHSHVGTMIYGGDNWPEIYRDHLFTHNLHGHQINHQVNVRQGSAYQTFHAGYDLAYVPHPAYVAVELKYGPDGAVYVTDWVDSQHCHNPRPETWDRTNGRIYRIAWAKTWQPVKVDLTAKTDSELAELLFHRNRWYANTARRMLQHRASLRPIEPSVFAGLRKNIAASGGRRLALESLWTLHVTGALDAPLVTTALGHDDEAVRAWAVRLATDSRESNLVTAEQLLKLAQGDSSSAVRLAIASALPALSDSDRRQIGTALALHVEDASDRFLPSMIWYGLASLVAGDVSRAVALAESTPLPVLKDSIAWYVAKTGPGRDKLVERIKSLDDDAAVRMLSLAQFSLARESSLPRPEGWDAIQNRFAEGPAKPQSQPARQMVEELSAVFGEEAVLKRMRGLLTNEKASVDARRYALGILNRVGDREAVAIYPRLLENAPLRPQVIPLLARSSDVAMAKRLIQSFPTFTPEEKAATLGVLTSRKEFALELLRAVDEKKIDRQELSALQIRQMHSLRDAQLTKLLEKVWGKIGVSSEEARKLIAKIKKIYTTAPLWAYNDGRGQQIFQKTCAACHPLDGTTVPLGPGLKGSWRNGLDYFLENIIDPNAVVGENYRVTVIVTEGGQVVTGLLDSESDGTVVLRTAEKTISIPKKEIAERKLADQSLMPTGLLDKMSEIEVIELLKFLLRSQ
jgi:putative membrane-bound dehydrogenase-like protein